MFPSSIPAGVEEGSQRKGYCGLASKPEAQPRSLSLEPSREGESGSEGGGLHLTERQQCLVGQHFLPVVILQLTRKGRDP